MRTSDITHNRLQDTNEIETHLVDTLVVTCNKQKYHFNACIFLKKEKKDKTKLPSVYLFKAVNENPRKKV